MDAIIARYAAVADRDLMLCRANGVAYQADMSRPVAYDAAYFDKYVAYEGRPIALMINAARVRLVNRHAGSEIAVLDIGVGSGEFIRSRSNTLGTDVNETARAWLAKAGKLSDRLENFRVFTMWDVIEHVPVPDVYFSRMRAGSHFFLSLPIFNDLEAIRDSKHYRPNEHFYYFTEAGLVDWLGYHGFRLLQVTDDETKAGREAILSFAFVREWVG